ncbi:MAG: rRNA pseudouridine synthase [Bacteroidia bacterium]|nr:MAG: rRNA pseudouridine synthase [Bacteroidia bacterium]
MKTTRTNPGRDKHQKPKRPLKQPAHHQSSDPRIRLNKFIANAGVCSRREADVLIQNGAITVNGQIVTEVGTKVMPGDKIMYGKQKLHHEKKIYVLLNKPKDYITTVDDPQQRKTVMHIIGKTFPERLYPVGRLDRNTTGLLLLTNDGELTKRLTHPANNIKKLYHVELDKNLTKTDMLRIAEGIKIEKEVVLPDSIAYANPQNRKEIGIELHSGQNRVVRRIFEQLGYRVLKLDRVMFAGLTKKDLPRGKWRQLSEKEVGFLKIMR